MKKIKFKGIIVILLVMLLSGCGTDASSESKSNKNYSFSPIVCSYAVRPTYGTSIDLIHSNVRVMDNNTIEVYCSDFRDVIDTKEIKLDYIYGETFEISEDQKQNIITKIKENEISELGNCGDENSCDGSYLYIELYDSDGESAYLCGGLNPHNDRFDDTVDSILKVLPENTLRNIRSKSEKVIVEEFMLEN